MNLPLFFSCVTCSANTAGTGNDAAGMSILFLLVVILVVICSVLFLMARMIRREQQNLDPSLCDEYRP